MCLDMPSKKMVSNSQFTQMGAFGTPGTSHVHGFIGTVLLGLDDSKLHKMCVETSLSNPQFSKIGT